MRRTSSTDGRGIFVSVPKAGGGRARIVAAGSSRHDFASFDDQRVGVAHSTLGPLHLITVVSRGRASLPNVTANGIYISEITYRDDDIAGANVVPAAEVLRDGAQITDLNGNPATISTTNLSDPINVRGEIAFWASFTDGRTAVIRASPYCPLVDENGQRLPDSDGNGLPDLWETFGVDIDPAGFVCTLSGRLVFFLFTSTPS